MSTDFEKLYRSYIRSIIKEDVDDVQDAENEDATAEAPVKCVCFKTSDPALIEALQKGISKITVYTQDEDEDGNPVDVPADFDATSFDEMKVTDCNEDAEVAEGEDDDIDQEAEGDDDMDQEGDDDIDQEGDDDMDQEGDDDIDQEGEGDSSKWLDDKGICVKCGDPACDGSCKCQKCGSPDCIGDCE